MAGFVHFHAHNINATLHYYWSTHGTKQWLSQAFHVIIMRIRGHQEQQLSRHIRARKIMLSARHDMNYTGVITRMCTVYTYATFGQLDKPHANVITKMQINDMSQQKAIKPRLT